MNHHNSTTNINIGGDNSGNIAVSQDNVSSLRDTIQNTADDTLREVLGKLIDTMEEHKLTQKPELLESIEHLAKEPSKTLADKLIEHLSVYTTIANIPLITTELAKWARVLFGV